MPARLLLAQFGTIGITVCATVRTGLAPPANFRCMKDLEPQLQMRARMAIALAYFTGITVIVGLSLPEGAAAYRRAERTIDLADTGFSGAWTVPAKLMPATAGKRNKVNCAGCGVIETVRTIDTREAFAGGCDAGELGRPHIGGKSFAAGGRDVESLADTVAAMIADQHAVRRVAVITRHQIVVRFPDGTRHMFDEATPRTLRVGERVRVIAGAPGPTI